MRILKKLFPANTNIICAISSGKIIHIEELPDAAFSNRLIGDGIAIAIDAPHIYAPCHGKIGSIAPTKHAFTILMENGLEVLIHIGLNTSKPNMHDFHYHVKTGDRITPETHVLTLSKELLKTHQFQVVTPIVILNHNEHPIRTMTISSYVRRGKKLFTFK